MAYYITKLVLGVVGAIILQTALGSLSTVIIIMIVIAAGQNNVEPKE